MKAEHHIAQRISYYFKKKRKRYFEVLKFLYSCNHNYY